MASRALRFLPPVTAVIFMIIALVFSLLAVTSRKWAERNTYDRLANPEDFICPIYTLYRSPFIVCTPQELPLTQNVQSASASSTSTAQGTATSTGCAVPTSSWAVTCEHFKPFGADRTSCELETETHNDTALNVGDARLCQQIHYAGNFSITSTFFIGLGFILTAAMMMMTFLKAGRSNTAATQQQAHRIDDGPVESTYATNGGKPTGTIITSLVASYINLVLVVVLFVGVVSGGIAQYFGILGLIQSQPNQADFASSGGNSDATHGNHGPWYQGVGLSTYATCAWGFAAAAGTIATMTWDLPRWNGLL